MLFLGNVTINVWMGRPFFPGAEDFSFIAVLLFLKRSANFETESISFGKTSLESFKTTMKCGN